MAADGGMIAEDFIFDHRLAGAYGFEENGFVGGDIAVAGRRGEGFGFEGLVVIRSGLGMLRVPLGLILFAQARGPAFNGINLRLGRDVLWSES